MSGRRGPDGSRLVPRGGFQMLPPNGRPSSAPEHRDRPHAPLWRGPRICKFQLPMLAMVLLQQMPTTMGIERVRGTMLLQQMPTTMGIERAAMGRSALGMTPP